MEALDRTDGPDGHARFAQLDAPAARAAMKERVTRSRERFRAKFPA